MWLAAPLRIPSSSCAHASAPRSTIRAHACARRPAPVKFAFEHAPNRRLCHDKLIELLIRAFLQVDVVCAQGLSLHARARTRRCEGSVGVCRRGDVRRYGRMGRGSSPPRAPAAAPATASAAACTLSGRLFANLLLRLAHDILLAVHQCRLVGVHRCATDWTARLALQPRAQAALMKAVPARGHALGHAPTRCTFSRRRARRAAADVHLLVADDARRRHRTALATYPCVRSLPCALSAGPCEVGFRGVQEAPV